MSKTIRNLLPVCAAALALAGIFSQAALATTINYGSFGPVAPGVTFVDVKESSGTDPVPLYGPPTPFSIGLDFNPTNFVANADGVSADITDGQLNFSVSSMLPITQLHLAEGGNYSLSGLAMTDAEVGAGAIILATVTEINGTAVTPFNLPAVNTAVAYDLANNAGLNQPWAIALTLDVASQVDGVTGLDVVINNSLTAVSEPSSIAFIAKNDFTITVEVIPEPGSVALASFALVGLAFATRRRG